MSTEVIGTGVTPALPSLPARAVGVLISPRATFAAIVANPRWLGMLALTVVIIVLTGAAFLSTSVGRQALLDQQVSTMESFGVKVDDARYAQLQERLKMAPYFQAGGTLVMAPLIAFASAGILLGVFTGLLGGTATYRQVLAVVVHSGAVNIVRQLFVTPLSYARESLSSPTNLSVFFPMLDDGSVLASFLGAIDLFVLWWGMVLAIGLGVLFKRRTGPIAVGLLILYAVIALVIALVKSALGGQ